MASGDSLKSLHYNFRVGICTAYNIICETCQALWDVLSPVYLKFPEEADWLKIAADFKTKLNFPNCVGAVDGKHIQIVCPDRSGSMYFNYLKYFSTNLLAVCDAHKNFTYVDVCGYGSQSDGGVLFHSTLGKRLCTNDLNLPQPTPLPNTTTSFPFFIIGDSGFPLMPHLLTPYFGNYLDLSDVEANFNEELSSVRKLIENTFGIMVKRWQIFAGPIEMNPKNADKIVKAAVVLHNYIKSFGDEASIRYMREKKKDKSPTTERLRSFYETGLRINTANSSEHANVNRDVYANYLIIS